ncbi:MAG: SWIM zinc finger family protein [Bacteroidota bacterium]
MAEPLPIARSEIRRHTTEKVYERGVNYATTRAAGRLQLRGDELSARVLGSDVVPYIVRVRFDLDRERIEAVRCTCPYEWGGWCKHIVATLLIAMDHPERVQDRDALECLLDGFERDGLLALLLALADADPRLTEQIEHYVEHGHLPDEPDLYGYDGDTGYDDDFNAWTWTDD